MLELFLLTQTPTPPPQCHPSYPDVCLPISRDVNCSDIPDSEKPVRTTSKDDHCLDSVQNDEEDELNQDGEYEAPPDAEPSGGGMPKNDSWFNRNRDRSVPSPPSPIEFPTPEKEGAPDSTIGGGSRHNNSSD